MNKKKEIIEKIKSTKWDKDFKHKVAEGLGYRLTGFTKNVALEFITNVKQINIINNAYEVIMKNE